jgi:hypothetical protein
VLVVPLLGDSGHDASRTDSVTPHHDRMLAARLVEVCRAERNRVVRTQLEDMTDLDCDLEPEPASAHRAAVALFRLAEVDEAGLEIASGLDSPEVSPVVVRAGDELPVAESVVRHHVH